MERGKNRIRMKDGFLMSVEFFGALLLLWSPGSAVWFSRR